MRRQNPNKKRKRNSLSIFRVSLFVFFIIAFSGAVLTQTQAIKIKTQKNDLQSKISQIENNNSSTKKEIDSLTQNIAALKSEVAKKDESSKIAYLTFDDGPSNNTLEILRILKQYNVKATFFVNGKPELKHLYKAIADDGHALANHTYSHDYNTIYSSEKVFHDDVKKLDTFLQEITGQAPSYVLRYPGGSNNTISYNYGGKGIMKKVLKEMSSEYQFFDWNVDSTDASTFKQSKDKIVSNVLKESTGLKKAVILMHDLNPKTTTPEALPEIIEGLKTQGFEFNKLEKDSFAPQFTKVPEN